MDNRIELSLLFAPFSNLQSLPLGVLAARRRVDNPPARRRGFSRGEYGEGYLLRQYLVDDLLRQSTRQDDEGLAVALVDEHDEFLVLVVTVVEGGDTFEVVLHHHQHLVSLVGLERLEVGLHLSAHTVVVGVDDEQHLEGVGDAVYFHAVDFDAFVAGHEVEHRLGDADVLHVLHVAVLLEDGVLRLRLGGAKQGGAEGDE